MAREAVARQEVERDAVVVEQGGTGRDAALSPRDVADVSEEPAQPRGDSNQRIAGETRRYQLGDAIVRVGAAAREGPSQAAARREAA